MESWSRSPCDDPDSGPGLAIGLALGGCLLVAVLGAVACIWYRKRRMQTPTGSSTREPQQVEVTVAQPDSQKSLRRCTETYAIPALTFCRAKEDGRKSKGRAEDHPEVRHLTEEYRS